MSLDQKLRVHGEIEYRTFVSAGEQMVSMIIPYGVEGKRVDLEFRVSDFVAFGDYTADVASSVIDRAIVDTAPARRVGWFKRWRSRRG